MAKQKETINKSKKYGQVYGTRHKLSGGRFAWPHLVTAKESTYPVPEGQEKPAPRFEVTYLLPKEKAANIVAALQAEVKEMVYLYNLDEKTGKPKKQKIVVDDFLKDGDDMDTDKYPFFAGNYVFVPRQAKRPDIYDSQLNLLDPSQVEGGMPGVVIIKPFCSSHGITFHLLAVQTGKDDGVRFAGSAPAAKELLEALGDGDEGESDDDDSDGDVEVPVAAVGKKKADAKGTLNLDKLS